eukprot:CAMPEP_0197927028 /NCGR_PEP_ID=MMETSP1439-20131203/100094_1 /TAXON_ID=66791 /ORGANISM="Gonyaulax spinifera, Strain CCMP409" /LENGTH=87 /DNA_ID=CAMNT_0043549579 /DNA_START=65 /DNA_END=325 /DNA_ORIENTATION=-
MSLSAMLSTPASAFVSAPALPTSRVPHVAAGIAGRAEPRVESGAAAGAVPAAFALAAAAAGVAALARRRSGAISTRVLKRPIQVIEW